MKIFIIIAVLLSFIIVVTIAFFATKNTKEDEMEIYLKKYELECGGRQLIRGKENRGKNRGTIGENIVENIIKKYTSKYYSNVLMPIKRKNNYSEIDFIIPTTKGIELIEVKAWYGKISVNETNKMKVFVDLINHFGKHVVHERDNPHSTISSFRNDLIRFLKHNYYVDVPKESFNRTIVFTRNESDFSKFKEFYEDREFNCFYLNEFDQYMKALKDSGALDEKIAKYELPGWDKCYDSYRKAWVDVAIRNNVLEFKEKNIPTSEIYALLFLKNTKNKCIVQLINGKREKLHLDYNQLNYFSSEHNDKSISYFFVLNNMLHHL